MPGRPLQDLSQFRVGRLVARRRIVRPSSEVTYWECMCDCGRPTVVTASNLKSGRTQSCGCIARERASRQLKTHGMSRTPEYFAWSQMRARCRDKKHQAYKDYGGRGIYVCPEWDRGFAAFLRDMGTRPTPKHSLDRIDNDGPYAPGNVQWATMTNQHNNRRRNRHLELNGERHTVAEWAKLKGLTKTALYQRLENGWTLEKALTTPVR